MVLDSLGDSLRSTLDNLRNKNRISEDDIDTVVKEVQRSLLQADADVSIVTELSENIKKRALEEELPSGVTVRDHVLNIVYDELVNIIGKEMEIPLEEQTILLAGLQGSGKTTTASKMAWWFSKKGLKTGVIQTDTFRPGSYDQAKQLTEEAEVEFYGNPDEDDPVEIARNGLQEIDDVDVKIVDTAGRHALEDELISELKEIDDVVNPDRKILVIDAAIGQGVKEQAQAFQEAIGIDGISITKMDGTANGGGALTAANETDSTIAFIGTGETVKDIERFEAKGFVSRLLGMGDLRQLHERIERAEHETEDDWDQEDLLKGEFTMRDMKHQLEAMNQMGPLSEVMDMLPGGIGSGNLKKQLDDQDLNVQQEKLRDFEVIMDSMTEEELDNPTIVNHSRKERIAKGSGKDIETVEELFAQYNKMNKVLGQFNSEKDLDRMTRQLQGKL